MRAVCKLFAPIVLMLSLLCSFFSVNSAENGKFCLTDADAGKNRHFTVELKTSGVDDIAAFTAVLEYDSDALAFRGIKVNDEEVQCSAYCFDEGKVNLVYLCEEGVNATSEISLVTIEFKSLSSGESGIGLYVTDVVDSDGQDVSGFVSAGCTVTTKDSVKTVNSGRKPRTDKSERTHTTDATEETYGETYDETANVLKGTRRTKYSKDTLQTDGSFVTEKTVVFVALIAVVLVVVTAFIAYKAGMKKQQQRDFSSMKLISTEIKDRKNTDTKERNKNEKIT